MKHIFLIALTFNFLNIFAQDVQCQLKKIYHHHADDKLKNLELGSIILYCDKQPQIKKIGDKNNNGRMQTTFLIENTTPASSVQAMMSAFNKEQSKKLYNAQLSISRTKQGMELTVEYDPSTLLISYDFFDAITQDKGIIFRLYNHKLLQSLKAKEAKLLKLSYAKPTIIIDCGHGGSDQGTMGINKHAEKDVVLQIGKQLEKELIAGGFKVCMIRGDDSFVPIDQRTTQANALADTSLFISLHANYAPRAHVCGIETYCLTPSLFNCGLQTSLDVLISPAKDDHYQLSYDLAQSIHKAVLANMKAKYTDVIDRNIRHAVAQVLVGTCMPATLIELGFLSNMQEAQRLIDPAYQSLLVRGMCKGIENFIQAHA